MRLNGRMHSRQTIIDRIAVGSLLVLLGIGLWQGYGSWLLRTVRAHVA
jgi:hypothetical protein